MCSWLELTDRALAAPTPTPAPAPAPGATATAEPAAAPPACRPPAAEIARAAAAIDAAEGGGWLRAGTVIDGDGAGRLAAGCCHEVVGRRPAPGAGAGCAPAVGL